jgi:nucleotide-binding universal stress UspA family protein
LDILHGTAVIRRQDLRLWLGVSRPLTLAIDRRNPRGEAAMDGTYRIVVGVDGSEGSVRALRWAAREAAVRGGTVQAITVWAWDGTGTLAPTATAPAEERARAEQILTTAVTKVADETPGVSFATDLIEDHAARALTRAARDADLLVLGSHGHSRLHHAVLGSISEECVRQATCPVVVLPIAQPQAAVPANVV